MKKLFLSIALSLMFLGCGGTNNEPEKQSNYDSKQFEVQLDQSIVDAFNKKIDMEDIKLNKDLKMNIDSEENFTVYKFTKDKQKRTITLTKEGKKYTGDFILPLDSYNTIIMGTVKEGKVNGIVKIYMSDRHEKYQLKGYSIYVNGKNTKENYVLYDRNIKRLFYGKNELTEEYGISKSENFTFGTINFSKMNILYSLEGKLIATVNFDEKRYYENDFIIFNEKKQKIKHVIRDEDTITVTNYDEKGEEQDTIIYY